MATTNTDQKTTIQTAAYLAQPLGDVVPDQVPALMPAVIPPTEFDFIPGDPSFGSQWHLNNTSHPGVDLNVTSVWDDYRGDGVVVGVIDTGIDYNHPDLAPNYRQDIDYDARDGDSDAYASQSFDDHGTTVAGVIGAAIGGGNTVGVAPGSDITGFRMGFDGGGQWNQVALALGRMSQVDVTNNSWSYTGFLYDNFRAGYFSTEANAVRNAATSGRGGLGSVITFSAGNSRQYGDDVNYHGLQNSRYTIAVGAIESDGDIANFSNPGAAVLVSAPGVGIYTTDVRGSWGYSSGDYTSINGTSFSAPAVAGVTALMLEANPNLGYRDVQEILAYSSRNPKSSTGGWQTNDAANWNAGGLTFSHDYGFGLADAHAAVRLAETWQVQSTEANLASLAYNNLTGTVSLPDLSTRSVSVNVTENFDIEHVYVHLHAYHSFLGDLTVRLTSPGGTVSTLVNRPGNGSIGGGTVDWDFTSVAHWGEDAQGTWTLDITDHFAQDSGTLYDVDLTFYGDTADNDDTYIFTDEWSRHGAEAGRSRIEDTTGVDTLNFAAVTSLVSVDLTPDTTNTLIGLPLHIAANTLIENVFGGDAGDILTGNAADNILNGMRGDDTLSGGAGDDVLTGGVGNDRLFGGDGMNTAVFAGNLSGYSLDISGTQATVSGGGEGIDVLDDVEYLRFADQVVNVIVPLVARDDAVSGTEDEVLTIDVAALLGNDEDSQGRSFDIVSVGTAGHGTVQLNGGQITYTGDQDFGGTDSFTYTIRNSVNDEATATVTVDMTPVADKPTFGKAYTNGWSYLDENGDSVRITHEVQVNTYTAASQGSSAIANLADGGYVVAWMSSRQNPDSINGVYGQRYDADGQPVGGEFEIADASDKNESLVDLTGLAGGGFVANWRQGFPNVNATVQVYDANGDKIGPVIELGKSALYTQGLANTAALPDGGFVAVWDSYGQDSYGSGVYMQRFDSAGNVLSGEVQVNEVESGYERGPAVEVLADGSFVVTFGRSSSQYTSGNRYARRFAADGSALSGEVLVGAGVVADPLALDDGGFAAIWEDTASGTTTTTLRLYDADMTPRGGDVLLAAYPGGARRLGGVDQLDGGGFIVTWQTEDGQDGDGKGVLAQLFDATGVSNGDAFQVNETIYNTQYQPAIVARPDGGFIITWDAFDFDDSSFAVVSKTYDADGQPAQLLTAPDGSIRLHLFLSDIATTDIDGSERYREFRIAGVPDTASVTKASKDVDGDWVISTNELSDIYVVLDDPTIDPFDITVTMIAEERDYDSRAASDPVTLTVTPPRLNYAPGADDVAVSVDEDGSLAGTLTATDLNGDAVTFSLDAAAAHGTVTVAADGSYTYTPDADWSGTDSFTFTVDDGNGGTDTGTVTVDVTPVADAPVVSANVGQWQQVLLPETLEAGQELQLSTQADNGTNGGEALYPYAATLTDGSFVASWTVYADSDGDGSGVFAQRFDAAGNPTGPEFQVNTTSAGYQNRGQVGALADGGFLVAWTAQSVDGDNTAVVGQRYDASGNRIGGEFQINQFATSSQQTPVVKGLPGGGFVVAWNSYRQDGDGFGRFGRIFDADGTSAGSEFRINHTTGSSQAGDDLTVLSDGRILVTWTAKHQPGGNNIDAVGRILDPSGNFLSEEFIINGHTFGLQSTPRTAALSDGGFVVTWKTFDQQNAGTAWDIYAQRYDADGGRVGGEFQVNSYAFLDQDEPRVLGLADGGFVIAWESSGQDGSSEAIIGQRYDVAGQPVGGEFLINTMAAGRQQEPFLTETANGGFMALWRSQNLFASDVGPEGIFAKIFEWTLLHNVVAPLAIDASPADTDGSESIVGYTVSGLPSGVVLSAGTDNGDGSWDLTSADLADLNLILSDVSLADFDLTVAVTSAEAVNSDTATASTTLTVEIPNLAPVAADETVGTNEDTAFAGQLTATDANGDALTYTLDTGTSNGQLLLGADGSYIYTPDADWSGSDGFTYTVDDGNGGAASATVTLNVAPVNDAPVAADDSGFISIAQPITITAAALLANDADIDGDTLSIATVGNAVNGSVRRDVNGDVVFTPDDGFEGTASFDYGVSDGQGGVDTASVSVTVLQPPDATSSMISLNPDGAAAWRLSGAGGQGGLNFDIVGPGGSLVTADASGWVTTSSGGRVRVTDALTGAYEYEAASGYSGADSFDFRVTDGRGLSSVATVSVGVGSMGHEISGSAGFDGASALTMASPGGGDTRRWTMSFWAQFPDGVPSNSQGIFGAGTGGGADRTQVGFSGRAFNVYNQIDFNSVGGFDVYWQADFSDPTAWYHVVLSYDSTVSGGSEDRIKLYVDGSEVTERLDWAPVVQGAETNIGDTELYQIGRGYNDGQYWGGQLAEFAVVDGQALDATSFGEPDGSGGWQATDLSGLDFGATGFLLNDPAGGADASGRGHDFGRQGLVAASAATPTEGQTQRLDPTAGNDVLTGGGDADNLDGLGGDDLLVGGGGDDTYLFGRGGGADTINNMGEGSSGDRVLFGANVDPDQLWFRQNGSDLVVDIIGTTDSVTISSWYASVDNHVDRFETVDGSTLDNADVTNLVSAMAGLAEPGLGETEISASSLTPAEQTGLLAAIATEWSSGS